MLAPPITYEIDGIQYVSILTGTGGGDLFGGSPLEPVPNPSSLDYNNYGRLLVFKLGGNAPFKAPQFRDRTIPEQKLAGLSDPEIAHGEAIYHDYCAVCHGLAVRSGGAIPDLRQMSDETHQAFNQITLEGVLENNGMPGFSDVISQEDMELVHHYIRARAHEDREVSLGNQPQPRWTWMTESP